MQTDKLETITFVRVGFSEDEYKLLSAEVKPPGALADFIHRVVMRSLRRKARKTKADVQP